MKKIFILTAISLLVSNSVFAYGKLDENTIDGFETAPITPYVIKKNEPKEIDLNYNYTNTSFGEATNESIKEIPAVTNRVVTPYTQPPKWEDYVPKKYINPRTDFTKKGAVAELTGGIILTCGVFSAPIGIPMIVHSSTKMKHINYAEKKATFEKGIQHAETIKDPTLRRIYYKKLLKKCKLSEDRKKDLAKKKKAQQSEFEIIRKQEIDKINKI